MSWKTSGTKCSSPSVQSSNMSSKDCNTVSNKFKQRNIGSEDFGVISIDAWKFELSNYAKQIA